MKKIYKMIGIFIATIIGLIIIIVTLFLNFSPQFGKGTSEKQKEYYAKLENFQNEKFKNQHHSPMNVNYLKIFRELIKKAPNRNPSKNVLVEKIDSIVIENHNKNITFLTWFGHSAFLLEIDGKIILIDPMLSEVPAPHPLLGPKRYSKNLPIEIEKLPFIDAVILSHDHYDH